METDIKVMIDEMVKLKDSYLSEVMFMIENAIDTPTQENLDELLNLLGRTGKRYKSKQYDVKQRTLLTETLTLELYGIVKNLEKDYEYNIKYSGIGESALVYNTIYPLINNTSEEITLFRISDKTYTTIIDNSKNLGEFLGEYAKQCANHINLGDNIKTNSYSKSLGVCLFKYLGQVSNENTFTIKMTKKKTNSIYEKNISKSIVSISDNPSLSMEKITNVVIDVSKFANEKLGSKESNDYWGIIVSDKPLAIRVVPRWDKEVLILDDSDSEEFKLTICDMLHLLIRYDTKMRGYKNNNLLVVCYVNILANNSELSDYFKDMNGTLKLLNEKPNEKIIDYILNSVDINQEQLNYADKTAWGGTRFEEHIDDIRSIADAITLAAKTSEHLSTDLVINQLKKRYINLEEK